MSWYLYMIECENNSIYTGITNDVEKRYAAHTCGKGAKYTRANRPRRLLITLPYPDRAEASKAEHAMKRLSAAAKRRFCNEHTSMTAC